MATQRVGLCLLLVALCCSVALAQTETQAPVQTEPKTHPRSAYTSSEYLGDVRPLSNWFLDSTISDGIDVEPFFELFDDIGNGIETGVRIAAWSYEALELGGQIGYIDIDGGGSGMSDFLIYGRYQIDIGEEAPEFAVGGTVDLPIGEESVGESTVDFRIYSAGRYDINEDFLVFGNLGIESLDLPTIGRESGILLGAGMMAPLTTDLVAIGEFNLGNNDFAAVTASLDYELPPGGHLRAGLALGLDSGAPDVLARFAFSIPLY